MHNRNQVIEKASVIYAAQIIIQRQSGLLSDAEAISVISALEPWFADRHYDKGQKIRHSDVAYEVLQSHTSVEHQPPDASGLLAIYRPIVPDHTGGQDDPIPFILGMDTRSGLYYSHGEKLYLCKSDMVPCVWPPDTAGIWQWEVIQ